MCIAIVCNEYTPCPGCNQNRTLHEYDAEKKPGRLLCKNCLMNGNPEAVDKLLQRKLQEVSSGNSVPAVTGEPRTYTMTTPGTPPPELKEDERAYYMQRWDEYKGHYRSPASFYVCHQIILEEINGNHLNSRMLESLGELKGDLQRQRQQSVTMLSTLHDMLPEKEAQDLMDDEKAMNSVYQNYIEEQGIRRRRGISRILSPAAIALAPTLPFPLDLRAALERLGYKTIEIEEAISMVERPPEGNEDVKISAVKIAEWYGFRLKQEYAMVPDSPLLEEAAIADLELDSNSLDTDDAGDFVGGVNGVE